MNKDFIEKIPVPIRWILFFPAAIIGMLLATFFFNIINESAAAYQGTWWHEFSTNTAGSFISALAFVYAGSCVAPKEKTVSIILGIIMILLGIALFIYEFFIPNSESAFAWGILVDTSTIIGGSYGIILVREHLK